MTRRLPGLLAILLLTCMMVAPKVLHGGEITAKSEPPKEVPMDWFSIVTSLGLPIALVYWFLRKDKTRDEEAVKRTETLEKQVSLLQAQQLEAANARHKEAVKTIERVTEALEQNTQVQKTANRTLRGILEVLQLHKCMATGRAATEETVGIQKTKNHGSSDDNRPPTGYRRVRSADDIPPPADDKDDSANGNAQSPCVNKK